MAKCDNCKHIHVTIYSDDLTGKQVGRALEIMHDRLHVSDYSNVDGDMVVEIDDDPEEAQKVLKGIIGLRPHDYSFIER